MPNDDINNSNIFSNVSDNANKSALSTDKSQIAEISSFSNTLNNEENLDDCNKNGNTNDDPRVILRELRTNNTERLIICHLNINFIQNKFESLKSLVSDNVDIIMISETKIDESFPSNQFTMEGYAPPFRLDRNAHGGGLLIYIREDIPCKEINTCHLPKDIESIFIEINLRNTKWLLMGGYNPEKSRISYFLNHIGNQLDRSIGKYDNLLLLGDFNSCITENDMANFCETYNLTNLINEPTCYKNAENPSSIDLILTNRKKCFQNSVALETGLSDHHKMTVTILKTYFKKSEPVVISYRAYKHFNENAFRKDLLEQLQIFDKENMKYDNFKSIFIDVLNHHAPLKKKTVRANNAPFMNKTLSKAFMYRSRLKNKFNNNPTNRNKVLYKKQRNYCVKLLKDEKKKFYNNLDLKLFDNNKKFWFYIKPLFSEKQKHLQKNLILIENDTVISDKEIVAEKLNTFFIETVENLDIEHFVRTSNDYTNNENIEEILKKYQSHPSVVKIKENVPVENKFSFDDITSELFEKQLLNLNSKKASGKNDIPVRALAKSSDIVSNYLSAIYNDSIQKNNFPSSLKLADVIPVFKKGDKTSMKNYRPISLLPAISKIFEKIMYNQILAHIDKYLSPYLFGFRRGHNTEQCLLLMIEEWKKALDNKHKAGAVLTDLSKAFDCLNHNLLLAKLDAYGFETSALKLINCYLKERQQRTKVGSKYSQWRELKFGVPQGSILGPLLFNIFINDIFLFISNAKIANYADDNTPYAIKENIESLLKTLESETNILLEWFRINEMKPNEDKCHLLIANQNELSVKIGNEIINCSNSVNLLGIEIDKDLNFSKHVTKLCKKGNQKLHALARVAKYFDKNKLRLIMKTFIQSQFNYCSSIWMFHNRTLNNKINKLHERALRIVYNNEKYTFQELLDLDNTVTIHHKNLQQLAIEMYKVKHNLSLPLINNLFNASEAGYDLRNNRCWEIPRVRTNSYGTETIRYRGPQIWEMLPSCLKEIPRLTAFKNNIKKWKPMGCKCRLCKTFVPHLGFL